MNRTVLIVVSMVVLLGGFALAARSLGQQETARVEAVARDHSKTLLADHAIRLGDPAAKVVIVEFFDPACETCAQFAPIIKDMVDKSDGRVQVVERYAPFHPGSEDVVAILEAARKQGLYWETLEILFSTQSAWADHHNPQPERIWEFLDKAGFDTARIRTDMKDPAIAALIAQDIKDAKTLGVKATPEFFVNGKPLPTWGLEQLKTLVKSELAANY